MVNDQFVPQDPRKGLVRLKNKIPVVKIYVTNNQKSLQILQLRLFYSQYLTKKKKITGLAL